MLEEVQDQFILQWGRMSSAWGINRTMAQIHALLFVTGEPLSVDEIIQRLSISRGNASMNLRQLMEWGIVRRSRHLGDRKDTYTSEMDPWIMLARVVRERKRREMDPTIEAIRDCLVKLRDDPADEAASDLRTRLDGLLEVFALVDEVYKQVFLVDRPFEGVVQSSLRRGEPGNLPA